MYDLHSHILHEVDDGSNTLKESIEIIKEAKALGIKVMVATPHYIKGSMDVEPDVLVQRFEEVKSELKKQNIEMTLYLGNELYFEFDLLDDLLAEKCLSINNTRYVLVELPFFSEIIHFESFVFELKLKGFTPILAHPERYEFVQKDIKALDHLIDLGILLQMNLASLNGIYGKTVKKTARKLVNRHMIHLIGTDVHRKQSKAMMLEKPLKILKKAWHEEQYNAVVHDNGKRVVENLDISPFPFAKKKRKWPKRTLLGLFIFLVLTSSLLYVGYKKVEAQFEAAMIEQARAYKASIDAVEEAARLEAEQKAIVDKQERDAEREAEKLERELEQAAEDAEIAKVEAELEAKLKEEEAAALLALEAASDDEERRLAEEAAEAAKNELEAQKIKAAEEQAALDAKRLEEEEQLNEAAAAEEARIEAERLEAERLAEMEKARLEEEMEKKYTDYESDKAKAMSLALSKLSVSQVNDLIRMAAGGFSPDEKIIAKEMFYNNFSDEEQQWILEMYVKYYGE